MMVHGRRDALIPVNHASRAYYALNRQVEGEGGALRYYEIENAQHLDALNPLYAGAGLSFVPIDYYVKQGLDLMWAHLTDGAALPPESGRAGARAGGRARRGGRATDPPRARRPRSSTTPARCPCRTDRPPLPGLPLPVAGRCTEG